MVQSLTNRWFLSTPPSKQLCRVCWAAALVCCLQGIEGHGFYGNCVVPIIENTARECELTDRLRQAIKDYPQANAVLVRRHGEPAQQPPDAAARPDTPREKGPGLAAVACKACTPDRIRRTAAAPGSQGSQHHAAVRPLLHLFVDRRRQHYLSPLSRRAGCHSPCLHSVPVLRVCRRVCVGQGLDPGQDAGRVLRLPL